MAQKQYVTYDIKKNIKLELNPAFIAGLQQIYTRYITEMYNNTENFGQLIKDFNETIMDPEAAKKRDRQFTPVESELYTLYSIRPVLDKFAFLRTLDTISRLGTIPQLCAASKASWGMMNGSAIVART